MSILDRKVPVNLSNLTCVTSSGPFAAVNRAIFTAHAAESDNADYRAMMAREVIKERTWRMWNYTVTPRDLVIQETHDEETTRVRVERINGEPL